MLFNQIKFYRSLRHLTQQELAVKCGCARNTICSIERYEYMPSLELAFIIARVLQVDIYELFYVERR